MLLIPITQQRMPRVCHAYYVERIIRPLEHQILRLIGSVFCYPAGGIRSTLHFPQAWTQIRLDQFATSMVKKIRELKMADGRCALFVARHNGISMSAFTSRLRKGMTIDEAATTPPQNKPSS